jgi:hypothetical protein
MKIISTLTAILFAAILVGCAAGPQSAPPEAATAQTDRDRLIGDWELVSYEAIRPDGQKYYPYGDHPVGQYTFDENGRMSVHVMKPGRTSTVAAPTQIAEAGVDDLRQIADGYVAYYGTWEVDEAAKTLANVVEAAMLPAWVGGKQQRTYELEGDRLALITPATRLEWTRRPN